MTREEILRELSHSNNMVEEEKQDKKKDPSYDSLVRRDPEAISAVRNKTLQNYFRLKCLEHGFKYIPSFQRDARTIRLLMGNFDNETILDMMDLVFESPKWKVKTISLFQSHTLQNVIYQDLLRSKSAKYLQKKEPARDSSTEEGWIV